MRTLYQTERSECGMVCVAMLASAHGLHFDLASLRARFPISSKGATLDGLIAICRDLNLDTRAVRCEIEDLNQLRLPAMLHWKMDHFVVLARVRRDGYVLHDPAVGRIVVSRQEMDRSFTGVAMEAWPGPRFAKADNRRRLALGAVIPFTRELTGALATLVTFALAAEVLALLLPILQQFVIDDVLVSADKDLLTILCIAMGVFLFSQAIIQAIRSLVQRNLSSSLSMIVPSHVYRHMVALPGSWFEKRSAADVATRFDSANSVHNTLTTSVVSAGIDGLVAVVAVVVMAAYSWLLTAIVVAAAVAYAALRVLWYRSYRNKSQGSLVQNAKVQAHLWETLRGIATVKTFNGATRRHSQHLANLSRYIRLQNGIATANALFALGHDSLFAIERIAVLYLGAKAVMTADFSIGMLTAFLGFRENFVGKATSLVNTAIEFRLLGIHLDRLSDILLTSKEHETPLPYLGERSGAGEVEVRRVGFRYGANEPDVLKNCSLFVASGEIVAIVGPSGAGKSTLFKLLTGQAAPESGEILIDGQSTVAIGLDRLREMIGVVRQDDTLFAGTIAENIAFFDDTPEHSRVVAAAIKAQIHDEIQLMPMGYNTLIGGFGTGLSGGQSQRVMLARALYRSPRILLLDEATSHLDLDNERTVSLALRDLGITQIVIAHRPETIAKADRVVDIRHFNCTAKGNVVVVKGLHAGAAAGG